MRYDPTMFHEIAHRVEDADRETLHGLDQLLQSMMGTHRLGLRMLGGDDAERLAFEAAHRATSAMVTVKQNLHEAKVRKTAETRGIRVEVPVSRAEARNALREAVDEPVEGTAYHAVEGPCGLGEVSLAWSDGDRRGMRIVHPRGQTVVDMEDVVGVSSMGGLDMIIRRDDAFECIRIERRTRAS